MGIKSVKIVQQLKYIKSPNKTHTVVIADIIYFISKLISSGIRLTYYFGVPKTIP